MSPLQIEDMLEAVYDMIEVGDGAVEVSSQRGGVDSFFDLFTMWNIFEFSLLAFGAAEKIHIEKKPIEGEVTETYINSVEYLTVFVGLGATIQW